MLFHFFGVLCDFSSSKLLQLLLQRLQLHNDSGNSSNIRCAACTGRAPPHLFLKALLLPLTSCRSQSSLQLHLMKF
jgi:hypothetical protein